MSRVSRPAAATSVLLFLAILLVGSSQWPGIGWAAGTTITAQRFYVEALTVTPRVALQDTFTGNAVLNGRVVPTIDPNGGITFVASTPNRPSWTATDTAWTTLGSQAGHGTSGAPSVASIPWLSRSSYVQVRLPIVTSTSNAGLGILCTSAASCIGARVRQASTTYYLDLGTLSGSAFTTASSPVCLSGPTCTITVGPSVSTTTDLRLSYNAATFVAQLTFGTSTASMTVPVAYRANTRAGLFAVTNSDGTRFARFRVGTL